jgi:hypothetical protein
MAIEALLLIVCLPFNVNVCLCCENIIKALLLIVGLVFNVNVLQCLFEHANLHTT